MYLPSASLPRGEHHGGGRRVSFWDVQPCSELCLQNLAATGLPAAGKLRKEIFPSYARTGNFQAGQQWARMPDSARTSEVTKSPGRGSCPPSRAPGEASPGGERGGRMEHQPRLSVCLCLRTSSLLKAWLQFCSVSSFLPTAAELF